VATSRPMVIVTDSRAVIGSLNQGLPHCPQITRVVWAASWRWVIRKGIFQDSLFPIRAVGTENVSYAKPVSVALWPAGRSHRLNNLLFAIHPPAKFLSSVLLNNFDLIFITVVVRHVFSP
jgi:hypothetical protein